MNPEELFELRRGLGLIGLPKQRKRQVVVRAMTRLLLGGRDEREVLEIVAASPTARRRAASWYREEHQLEVGEPLLVGAQREVGLADVDLERHRRDTEPSGEAARLARWSLESFAGVREASRDELNRRLHENGRMVFGPDVGNPIADAAYLTLVVEPRESARRERERKERIDV